MPLFRTFSREFQIENGIERVFCILYRDLQSKPITPFQTFRSEISEVSGDKPAPGATFRHLTPDCHKIGSPDFKFNSKSRARADERNIPPRQAVDGGNKCFMAFKAAFSTVSFPQRV